MLGLLLVRSLSKRREQYLRVSPVRLGSVFTQKCQSHLVMQQPCFGEAGATIRD